MIAARSSDVRNTITVENQGDGVGADESRLATKAVNNQSFFA